MKRILAILLILCLIPHLFACGKDAGKEEPTPAATEKGTEQNTVDERISQEENAILEMDMTDKMESWRGQGDSGKVKLPGDWNAVVVQTPEDLAPYRAYFPLLTNADVERVTADTAGIAVVLEVASPDTSLIYGVNEVTLEGSDIVFMVSSVPFERTESVNEDGEMEPDPGSPHEYFMFYIPAEHYHNEPLQFVFVT